MDQTFRRFLFAASVVLMLFLNPFAILAQQKKSKNSVDETMPGKQQTNVPVPTSETKNEPTYDYITIKFERIR